MRSFPGQGARISSRYYNETAVCGGILSNDWMASYHRQSALNRQLTASSRPISHTLCNLRSKLSVTDDQSPPPLSWRLMPASPCLINDPVNSTDAFSWMANKRAGLTTKRQEGQMSAKGNNLGSGENGVTVSLLHRASTVCKSGSAVTVGGFDCLNSRILFFDWPKRSGHVPL